LPVSPAFPAFNPFAVNRALVQSHLHTVEVAGSNPASADHKHLKMNDLHVQAEACKAFEVLQMFAVFCHRPRASPLACR
jgi:hypothetical protein